MTGVHQQCGSRHFRSSSITFETGRTSHLIAGYDQVERLVAEGRPCRAARAFRSPTRLPRPRSPSSEAYREGAAGVAGHPRRAARRAGVQLSSLTSTSSVRCGARRHRSLNGHVNCSCHPAPRRCDLVGCSEGPVAFQQKGTVECFEAEAAQCGRIRDEWQSPAACSCTSTRGKRTGSRACARCGERPL